MIDIHAHVLPGLDDGAADLAEAKALIAEYGRQGVTDIICTSHLLPQQLLSDDDSFLQCYDDVFISLRAQFANCERPVRLHRGYEQVLMSDLEDSLQKFDKPNQRLTLAKSSYLLVELPRWLSGGIGSLEKLLFGLQIAGFNTILAHPERIVDLAAVLPMIYRWIEQERVLLQINTSAIVAPRNVKSTQYEQFKRRQASVGQMIRTGMVHFVASDAHNLHSRPPQNKAAWTALTAAYGVKVARRLMLENPAAVLADRPITARLIN